MRLVGDGGAEGPAAPSASAASSKTPVVVATAANPDDEARGWKAVACAAAASDADPARHLRTDLAGHQVGGHPQGRHAHLAARDDAQHAALQGLDVDLVLGEPEHA
jgi:hypothetical protein